MQVIIPPDYVVVFDLDDTLYKERDFLVSGYRAVARHLAPETWRELAESMLERWSNGEVDVLQWAIELRSAPTRLSEVLDIYRYHKPEIAMATSVRHLLSALQAAEVQLGLLTDGRSRTQRAKLRALGIENAFAAIVISEEIGSEKPALANFKAIEAAVPAAGYFYVADNTAKDFLGPNQLGWTSVCLRDDGRNIHPQSFDASPDALPDFVLDELSLASFKLSSSPAK